MALTNFQGDCMGNFQGVLRHFQGGLKFFLGGRGLRFFSGEIENFSQGVGIFRERVEIYFECLILFQLWLCYFGEGEFFNEAEIFPEGF